MYLQLDLYYLGLVFIFSFVSSLFLLLPWYFSKVRDQVLIKFCSLYLCNIQWFFSFYVYCKIKFCLYYLCYCVICISSCMIIVGLNRPSIPLCSNSGSAPASASHRIASSPHAQLLLSSSVTLSLHLTLSHDPPCLQRVIVSPIRSSSRQDNGYCCSAPARTRRGIAFVALEDTSSATTSGKAKTHEHPYGSPWPRCHHTDPMRQTLEVHNDNFSGVIFFDNSVFTVLGLDIHLVAYSF